MLINREKKKMMDPSESGSLNDLAFLLIIYFIIIATFNVNQGFILSLPQKSSSKIVNIEDIIKVNLNKDGELSFKDQKVSYKELEELIVDRLKVRPNMTFLLKIDPDTAYQNVVYVVDIVKKLKVDNFSFSMEDKK